MTAHPHRCRLGRLVNVHTCDREAVRLGVRSPTVWSNKTTRLLPDLVEQQLLYLGVILGFDALIVGEFGLGRVRHVEDNLEGILVDSKIGLPATGVFDDYRAWGITEVTLRGDLRAARPRG